MVSDYKPAKDCTIITNTAKCESLECPYRKLQRHMARCPVYTCVKNKQDHGDMKTTTVATAVTTISSTSTSSTTTTTTEEDQVVLLESSGLKLKGTKQEIVCPMKRCELVYTDPNQGGFCNVMNMTVIIYSSFIAFKLYQFLF